MLEVHLYDGAYDIEVEQTEPDGALKVVAYASGPVTSKFMSGITITVEAHEVSIGQIATRENTTTEAVWALIRETWSEAMDEAAEERWERRSEGR